MSFLDRLESRFGRFAIRGLIRYVVALSALVYILEKVNPYFIQAIDLWPRAILQGEVWRLVTYIFIPQAGSYFFPDWFAAAMYLGFLWWVGSGLEEVMGPFRLNLYYFTGMFGITIAAFFFGGAFAAVLLNTTLLFAFAHLYPDEMIFVYIIPAKVKWLAWLAAAGLVWSFLSTPYWSFRISLVIAFSNYFLFFGPEIIRNARVRQQVAERRRKFDAAKAPDTASLHDCVVCHRTELTNPELEFRVARDGQEYCREHLPAKAPQL